MNHRLKKAQEKFIKKLREYEKKHPRLYRWEMERRKEIVHAFADEIGINEFIYEIMSEVWLSQKD
jgi:hypothetical protein